MRPGVPEVGEWRVATELERGVEPMMFGILGEITPAQWNRWERELFQRTEREHSTFNHDVEFYARLAFLNPRRFDVPTGISWQDGVEHALRSLAAPGYNQGLLQVSLGCIALADPANPTISASDRARGQTLLAESRRSALKYDFATALVILHLLNWLKPTWLETGDEGRLRTHLAEALSQSSPEQHGLFWGGLEAAAQYGAALRCLYPSENPYSPEDWTILRRGYHALTHRTVSHPDGLRLRVAHWLAIADTGLEPDGSGGWRLRLLERYNPTPVPARRTVSTR